MLNLKFKDLDSRFRGNDTEKVKNLFAMTGKAAAIKSYDWSRAAKMKK